MEKWECKAKAIHIGKGMNYVGVALGGIEN
jgi:hypothetical protein